MPRLLLLSALALLAGCNIVMRRWIDVDERGQVIRVESSERLYFDLDEDAPKGSRWYAECADPDVLVKIDHAESERSGRADGVSAKAAVEIRIHRGYDGPSEVVFRRRDKDGKLLKAFTITLFRRTGDCAFWK